RLVVAAELDQVRADVVVRVSEVGIDRDRLLALRDRVVETALEAVRPAEERVRLGGRVERDRTTVAVDRALELPFHLQAVGFLHQLHRLSQAFLGSHRRRNDTPSARGVHPEKWPASASAVRKTRAPRVRPARATRDAVRYRGAT